MMNGKVKFYSTEREFGIIAPDDGSHGLVVDTTALLHSGIPSLAEGQAVTYETREDAVTGKAVVTVLQIAQGDIVGGIGAQATKPRSHRQAV